MCPLVSVHNIGSFPSDPHKFTDSPDTRITLVVKDFSMVPINNMIVLHSMICDSRFREFRRIRESIGP